MDKVLSTRLDEAVIRRIQLLARQLNTTKKAVIERAVLAFAEEVEAEQGVDVLEQTLGAWQRKEPVEQTVAKARQAFRRSMYRHHGP